MSPHRPSSPRLRLALAALLLAAARGAAASDGALELCWAPLESEWLVLRGYEARLDGVPLPVPRPEGGQGRGQLVLRGPLDAGSHRLEVVATLSGDSSVFTYVNDVRFTMKGTRRLDVRPGDVVEVRAQVVAREGATLRWEDRYRLVLDATVRQGAKPAAWPFPPPAAPAASAPPARPSTAAR